MTHNVSIMVMKVPLKLYLAVCTKLPSRLSSVRWTLLLITAAMFFLSAASTGCPTGGYTLSVAPNTGPNISNPPAPATNQPPPNNAPVSQLPAAASTPAIPVIIPATPGPPSAAAPLPAAAPSAAAPLPAALPSVAAPLPVAAPAPKGPVVTVKMVLDPKNSSGFGFSPETVKITKGTTVTWVNATAIPHTVTSDDGKFMSSSSTSPVMQDQKYSFVFSTAGTFKYHCAIHPPQVGTITVQ